MCVCVYTFIWRNIKATRYVWQSKIIKYLTIVSECVSNALSGVIFALTQLKKRSISFSIKTVYVYSTNKNVSRVEPAESNGDHLKINTNNQILNFVAALVICAEKPWFFRRVPLMRPRWHVFPKVVFSNVLTKCEGFYISHFHFVSFFFSPPVLSTFAYKYISVRKFDECDSFPELFRELFGSSVRLNKQTWTVSKVFPALLKKNRERTFRHAKTISTTVNAPNNLHFRLYFQSVIT